MSTKKVEVPIAGEMVSGVEVGYKAIKEDWQEYKLEDGTILRTKLVLSRVVRTEKYNPGGEPIYFFNTATVGSAVVPNKLKKTTKKE